MKAPAAGKTVNRFGDSAAGILDPFLTVLQIVRIENDKRPARRSYRGSGGQPAFEPPIAEFAIFRPIIGERPAESAAVEIF